MDNCEYCGSPIKHESNSLHVWEVEYECGYTVCGAIDTKTHGDDIIVVNECLVIKK